MENALPIPTPPAPHLSRCPRGADSVELQVPSGPLMELVSANSHPSVAPATDGVKNGRSLTCAIREFSYKIGLFAASANSHTRP